MQTVKLKRGYSIRLLEDGNWNKSDEVVILGNYSKSGYKATEIVSVYGICPTFRENHGQVTAIAEEENYVDCNQGQ